MTVKTERAHHATTPMTADLLTRIGVDGADLSTHLGDTYVLEAIEHLDRMGVEADWFAARCSLLLLKPDAVVARGVAPTLEWLAAHRWRILHAARVESGRHLARALWQTSWARASVERRRLADLLVEMCDSMVLLVTDDHSAVGAADGAVGGESATVRLTREKGPTDPTAGAPGELRHALGHRSYLLNLVHTPDTPVEVLREWSIMLDEPARAACLRDVIDGGVDVAERVAALAGELYSQTPSREFGRAVAAERVAAQMSAAAARLAPPGPDLTDDRVCADMLRSAWANGIDLDPWSVIVLGSHVLPMTSDPTRRECR
ncbi:nucleoside-diphosphate kinase [Gordonia polyisoprenivorans]|uniref:nucleoside-diphosphate kinase n=1 Tax=Gordonia polyisoprenivorans TaxID=84595 RepID=UPI002300898C|nr:nucleoside-diphosphate kinase [Gordonia polyisoprenivorans]WCB39898.1 nucleoside-diphosphate kinase [Gordonia polyisoprenivorans]